MIYTTERIDEEPNELNAKVGTLLSSYTQAVNHQYNQTGSIFRASTKAKSLDTTDHMYPRTCFYYIHQNPLKAKLVKKIDAWEFSSYREYANQRNGTLVDKSFAFRWLAIEDASDFICETTKSIDPGIIKKLY